MTDNDQDGAPPPPHSSDLRHSRSLSHLMPRSFWDGAEGLRDAQSAMLMLKSLCHHGLNSCRRTVECVQCFAFGFASWGPHTFLTPPRCVRTASQPTPFARLASGPW